LACPGWLAWPDTASPPRAQTPETETRLRETIAQLKATITSQRAELEELRRMVANLTLASAVLTQKNQDMQAQPAPGNAAPIRPAST
jgi:phage shock protein A